MRVVRKLWGVDRDFDGFSVGCGEGHQAIAVLSDNDKHPDADAIDLLKLAGLIDDEDAEALRASERPRIVHRVVHVRFG